METASIEASQNINTPTPTANGEDSLIILSTNTGASEKTAPSSNIFTQTINTENPITIEAETPSTENTPLEINIPNNSQSLTIAPESTITTETSVSQTPIIESTTADDSSTDSLFGSFSTNLTQAESTPIETQGVESSLLPTPISNIDAPEVSAVSTPTPQIEPAKTISNTPVSENSFYHPEDFIQKSVADIDHMIDNIDTKHAAKISEAEGYKAEKIRFTHLEKDAYAEASLMDDERKHALEMKELLLGELPENKNKTKDKNSHIETSLTGIAVANSVEKTMEKPKSHHHTKLAA